MNYYVNENKDENGKKSSIIVFACIGTFIVALGIVVYMLISSYNSFVDARADVEKAQTDVETMMQRRLELIPDLVEVVRNTKTAVVKISNTNACSQLTIMKNIIKIAV